MYKKPYYFFTHKFKVMRKALYLLMVRKATKFANRTEGRYTFSIWDDIAAFLWKEEFEK